MNRRDSTVRAFIRIVITASCALLLTVSCATRGDFSEIRREMNANAREVESRLSALEKMVTRIDSLAKEQYFLNQSLRALLGTQSREQAESIARLAARQDDINYLLKDLLEKLQVIQLYGGLDTKPSEEKKPETPSPSSPDVTGPGYSSPVKPVKVDPESLYETALKDIEQENYLIAENRLTAFLLQFPGHSLAPNAQYWLGEVAYAQSSYERAIKEFEKVPKKYPKSKKVSAALLKIGYSQIEMGEKKKGIKTLQKIIKSYKNSDEAKLAREKLKEID